MRRLRYSVCVVLLSFLVAGSSQSFAQEKKKSKVAMPSQEEIMKRWEAFATPGDPHKWMASMAGNWNMESKWFMAGPGSEPSVSTGTVVYSMILGGRYLKQEATGTMMGMPFEGVGINGYDNFKKKFVGTWIDNMGTAISAMEGTVDASGKVLTMWGTMDEPTTGEKNKKVKYVMTSVNADKHTFEIYDVTTYGEKAPVAVMTYTRKK
jgi:hypothetical protein